MFEKTRILSVAAATVVPIDLFARAAIGRTLGVPEMKGGLERGRQDSYIGRCLVRRRRQRRWPRLSG